MRSSKQGMELADDEGSTSIMGGVWSLLIRGPDGSCMRLPSWGQSCGLLVTISMTKERATSPLELEDLPPRMSHNPHCLILQDSWSDVGLTLSKCRKLARNSLISLVPLLIVATVKEATLIGWHVLCFRPSWLLEGTPSGYRLISRRLRSIRGMARWCTLAHSCGQTSIELVNAHKHRTCADHTWLAHICLPRAFCNNAGFTLYLSCSFSPIFRSIYLSTIYLALKLFVVPSPLPPSLSPSLLPSLVLPLALSPETHPSHLLHNKQGTKTKWSQSSQDT